MLCLEASHQVLYLILLASCCMAVCFCGGIQLLAPLLIPLYRCRVDMSGNMVVGANVLKLWIQYLLDCMICLAEVCVVEWISNMVYKEAMPLN